MILSTKMQTTMTPGVMATPFHGFMCILTYFALPNPTEMDGNRIEYK
jgi:hypothetical protein